MGALAVGDVVLVNFPYADFKQFKKRPALVVGLADFGNLILCQITSKTGGSPRAIRLTDADFAAGGLVIVSCVRPDKIFTVERGIITATVDRLHAAKTETILAALRSLFS